MASQTELMALGTPALVARALGQNIQSAISAAGTTQATATLMTGGFALFTTVAANSGGRLPSAAGQEIAGILNAGANTLTVYPATGEQINNLSANTGIQIAAGKCAILMPHSNRWIAILGT